jgi:hypothetical protein
LSLRFVAFTSFIFEKEYLKTELGGYLLPVLVFLCHRGILKGSIGFEGVL